MIVVTGAAGFIGSVMVGVLNQNGYTDLVLADDFGRPDKMANLHGKTWYTLVHRDVLLPWLADKGSQVQAIIHLGARTDTEAQDKAVFDRLNVHYTQALWLFATQWQIPFFYASSAATYGGGEHGFDDNPAGIPALRPLNPYGQSKQDADLWILAQQEMPYTWAGFKFFNVYGPNEYHKGRMASVAMHAHRQIKETGRLKLFRSHHPGYTDGGQMRDFIYVMDVARVLLWCLENREVQGIYNLGTGQASTFLELAEALFASMGRPAQIEFIDTPASIRDSYQYYTQADTMRLRQEVYTAPFFTLAQGIDDYVQQFLNENKYF